jgi:hypothetical protein
MRSILGKLISTPIRLANIPVKVAEAVVDHVVDTATGVPSPPRRLQDRDPLGLDQVADAIDDAVER